MRHKLIKLRDHYFISWLKAVKNINYTIDSQLNILVNISSEELKQFQEEYNSTLKSTFQSVRSLIKELNILTTKP